jgi:hypothetical protein
MLAHVILLTIFGQYSINGSWWQGMIWFWKLIVCLYLLSNVIELLEHYEWNCCTVRSTYLWKIKAWPEWLGKSRNKVYCMLYVFLIQFKAEISYFDNRNFWTGLVRTLSITLQFGYIMHNFLITLHGALDNHITIHKSSDTLSLRATT